MPILRILKMLLTFPIMIETLPLAGDGSLHQLVPAPRPHWEDHCQCCRQRQERVIFVWSHNISMFILKEKTCNSEVRQEWSLWWSTGQERMNLAILEFIVKDKYNPPFDDQVPIRECCWQRKGKWNLAILLRGYLPWTCALMLKCIYIKNVRNCGNILKGLPMAKSHRTKNIFF